MSELEQAVELAKVTEAMERETQAREVYDYRKRATGEAMRIAREVASLREVAEAAGVSHEEVRRRTVREPAAA